VINKNVADRRIYEKIFKDKGYSRRGNMSNNRHINVQTRQKLYARSGNKCAMYGCDNELFPVGKNFNASVIAHIEGVGGPKSARHNSNLSTKEVNGYDNLILLCYNHHTEVDARENEDKYTMQYLKKMKKDHEDLVTYKSMFTPPKDWEIPSGHVALIKYICENNRKFRDDIKEYDITYILNLILNESVITRFILYSIIINARLDKKGEMNMFQVLSQLEIDKSDITLYLMVLQKCEILGEHFITNKVFINDVTGDAVEYEDWDIRKLKFGKWFYTFYGRIIYAWYESLLCDKDKFFNALVERNVNEK